MKGFLKKEFMESKAPEDIKSKAKISINILCCAAATAFTCFLGTFAFAVAGSVVENKAVKQFMATSEYSRAMEEGEDKIVQNNTDETGKPNYAAIAEEMEDLHSSENAVEIIKNSGDAYYLSQINTADKLFTTSYAFVGNFTTSILVAIGGLVYAQKGGVLEAIDKAENQKREYEGKTDDVGEELCK